MLLIAIGTITIGTLLWLADNKFCPQLRYVLDPVLFCKCSFSTILHARGGIKHFFHEEDLFSREFNTDESVSLIQELQITFLNLTYSMFDGNLVKIYSRHNSK